VASSAAADNIQSNPAANDKIFDLSNLLVSFFSWSVTNSCVSKAKNMIETKAYQLNRDLSETTDPTRPIGDPLAVSDSELVARTIRRDITAFQMLIDRYQPTLQQMITRLLVSPSESQDVLQDVFLEVWTKVHTYSARSSLKTWLCQIAIHRCRNRNRSWKRWRSFIVNLQSRVTRCATDHTKKVDSRWARVETAMKRLTNADRELLVMYYLEEIPLCELIEIFQCRENTLEVRLHRARQRLSQLLESSQ
jgi:RNA polymerase sigma-70 factor (ECF subfamily)